LRENFPDIEVVINREKPRKGSFELTFERDGKKVELWTGVKKGPPRNLKFPDHEELLAEIESIVNHKDKKEEVEE